MTQFDSEQLASLTQIPKVKRSALTARPEQSASYDAGASPSDGAALDLSCWNPTLQSEDMAISQAGDVVPARVIDQVHNDGTISGAAQRIDDTMVGTGLKLSMSVDHEAMGITKEQGKALNTLIEREFRTWTRSSRNSPDVTRKVNWPAMQVQGSRSTTYQGEILASFEPRRSPMRGEMQCAIRIIDPSRLSDPKDNAAAMRDRDIRSGIEYDSNGAPVAYWISSRAKNDQLARNKRHERLTWTRYPKWGRDGRIRIFHAFDPTRAEQSRGISPLAATMRAAKMIDKVADATLQSALLQTLFALVVKSNSSWKDLIEVLGVGKETDGLKTVKEYMKTRSAFYKTNPPKVSGTSGARAIHLLPDETMELTSSKAANPDIGGFLDAMRQEVARGSGMSMDAFTGDYSKTNLSAARIGSSDMVAVQKGRRARLLDPFLSWVLEHFVEELFVRKPEALPVQISFYDHRDALTNCTWIGAPAADPDPEKTAKAADKRLSAGYSTMKYECAILGLDYEEVIEQQALEASLREEHGLLEAAKKEVDSQQPTPEPKENGGSDGSSDNS